MRTPLLTAPNGVTYQLNFDSAIPEKLGATCTTLGRTIHVKKGFRFDLSSADLLLHETMHVPQWCWFACAVFGKTYGPQSWTRFLGYPFFLVLYLLGNLVGLAIAPFIKAPGNPFEWIPWVRGYDLELHRAYEKRGYGIDERRIKVIRDWERHTEYVMAIQPLT